MRWDHVQRHPLPCGQYQIGHTDRGGAQPNCAAVRLSADGSEHIQDEGSEGAVCGLWVDVSEEWAQLGGDLPAVRDAGKTSRWMAQCSLSFQEGKRLDRGRLVLDRSPRDSKHGQGRWRIRRT